MTNKREVVSPFLFDQNLISAVSGLIQNSPVFTPIVCADPPTDNENETNMQTNPILTIEPITETTLNENVTIRSDVVEIGEPIDLSSSSSRINQSIQSLGELQQISTNLPTVIIPLEEQQAAREILMQETTTTTTTTQPTNALKTKSSITITKINPVQPIQEKRTRLQRGTLPKKSRQELHTPVTFAPRKPPPKRRSTEEQATTSRQAELRDQTEDERTTENSTDTDNEDGPWILDYEWKTYYRNLSKQKGYDEFQTYNFNVFQPEGEDYERQTNQYFRVKRLLHQNQPPTNEDKTRARQNGYVLEDDWKTQFTIQGFGGIRHVNNKVKAIATQFRRRDGKIELQWERVENIKKFAESALKDYLKYIKNTKNKTLKI